MAVEKIHQIILLPHENFWEWVRTITDYVKRYGVEVSPSPENTIAFQRPHQTVTIIDFANAYPMHGDIVTWFSQNASDVKTDVIATSSTVALNAILQERIDKDWRFGVPPVETVPEPEPTTPPTGEFKLQWPTDFDFITQHFGENPDIYAQFGLPGHEGLDIRARLDTNIYAANSGTVVRAERDVASGGAYGKHIRIQHEQSYRTVYAHLNEVLVNEGDVVRPGQLIGLANSTGNSSGSHLHLTLKQTGATSSGQTDYPFDIIDPTPFLLPFGVTLADAVEQPDLEIPEWQFDNVLVGLHGRADGPMFEPDWQAVTAGRVEALKLLSWARGEDVDRARQINPDMFILVRAMFGFGQDKISPPQFAETVGNDMQKHYDRGVRYFEVHNEPNLTIEGWGKSWRDGSEFAQFFLDVIEILKQRFPEALWGFPGCSPGHAVAGQRMEMWSFIEGAQHAIEHADWIGVHCYWQGSNDGAVLTPETGLLYQAFRDRWPSKLMFITEFSNSDRNVDKATKGRQYVKYYDHLRQQAGVGAAFSFVASASSFFEHEAWRSENGSQSEIPGAIGRRNF